MPKKPDIINVLFGKNVRKARQHMKLTRQELATFVQMSYNSLLDLETNGTNNVRLVTAYNIARVLHTPLIDLLEIPCKTTTK
jgi:transcriptional regulator with XRE-family HTH domain